MTDIDMQPQLHLAIAAKTHRTTQKLRAIISLQTE